MNFSQTEITFFKIAVTDIFKGRGTGTLFIYLYSTTYCYEWILSDSANQDTKVTLGYSQSSILRFMIRPNYRVLCVTRIASCTDAMAEISKSFGPIGVPFRTRSERISPYLLAASSSKESDSKLANNSSKSAMFLWTRLLFMAPKNNSAFTTAQR